MNLTEITRLQSIPYSTCIGDCIIAKNCSLAVYSFSRSPTFPFGEGGPPKVVDEVKTVDTQSAFNSNLTHRSAPSLRGAPLPKGEGQGRGRLTDKPKFEAFCIRLYST